MRPLEANAAQSLLKSLHDDWSIDGEGHLSRSFSFPDFKTALAFVQRVGALAEVEGHHPDILLRWGRVVMTVWTHSVGGLTESDFILAAKTDPLFEASGAA